MMMNGPKKLVLVFDYDWSLINDNSDTYVFKVLGPNVLEFVKDQSRKRPGDWTNVVDEGLQKLQTEQQVDLASIEECLANVPVLDGMIDSIKEIHGSGNGTVHIVSDASQFFIDSFLKKHDLHPMIASVQTNKSYIHPETGHLRVKAYHDEPHSCPLCPKNLCKGSVLEALSLLHPENKIIYVGDGGGDFCPSVRMREHDLLLVRNDENYPSAMGLVKRVEREKERYPVKAQIMHWKTGQDVLNIVRKIIQQRQ